MVEVGGQTLIWHILKQYEIQDFSESYMVLGNILFATWDRLVAVDGEFRAGATS
jgi:hypothetical protein